MDLCMVPNYRCADAEEFYLIISYDLGEEDL